MEKTLRNTISSGVLLFYGVLHSWDIQIHNFLSYPQFFLQHLTIVSTKWKAWTNKKYLNTESLNQQFCFHDKELCRGDIKMVMDRLGINYDSDREKVEEKFGADELSILFEVEPSLDEVKEAFNVFDDNRDGFIDATELQRVLSSLGLEEGSEVANCKRMIRAFDENGDGRIDFNEFLKFIEMCFC